MITKPKYKTCKRVGSAVYPQCETQSYQKSLARGGRRRPKRQRVTEYGVQLIEKQKVRFTYNITEKQLVNSVNEARRARDVNSHEKVFELLERRLDNVLYRSGFLPSRAFARQAIGHGHILVNGIRVRIPSYQVKPSDAISPRKESRDGPMFIREKDEGQKSVSWLSLDSKKLEVIVLGIPKYEERQEAYLDFAKVVEHYLRV